MISACIYVKVHWVECNDIALVLDDGVVGVGGDSAVVVSAGHEHVAIVTPVLRPAVLHDPVVSAL